MALCVPWAHGQTTVTMTAIVADGTSTSRNVPVYSYYCDAINVAQVIYPASELTDLTNGDVITAMHFFISSGDNTGKWDASTFNVSLANTTQNDLSSSFDQTESTLVYSGFLSATDAAGMTVTFTTPFTYTGGNLLIQFAQPNSSDWASTYFYGKSVDGAGRYKSGSTSITSGGTVDNVLPKCEFTFQTIPPACIPLKRVTVSDVTRTGFTVTWENKVSPVPANCTGYELKLSGSSNPDDAGTTVTINDTSVLTYTFEHLERDTTYYVHVRSNCGVEDGYSTWVSTSVTTKSLNGCAVIGDGTSAVSGVPTYSSYGNTYSQQIFTAEELTAAGVVPGAIEGISYTWNQSSSYTKHLTIFLGHTTKEAFSSATDWESASAFTQYYDDDDMQVTGAGTVNYTFSTPFVWDGVSNVIIATIVGQTTGGSSTGSTGFSAIGTTCSVNRSCYMYKDSYVYGIDPFETSAKTGGGAVTGRANVGFCQNLEACPAVTNVAVSDIAQTTANLSWTASMGDYANDYDVLVSTTPVDDFTSVVPTYSNLDTTGQVLTGLSAYTDYYVYVRVNCDGYGHDEGEAWSEAAQFKTLSYCVTPTDFNVELLSKRSAKASWTPYPDQTSSYRYILSTTEIENPDVVTPDSTGMTGDTVLLDGLTPGQVYYLYISNDCGGSDGYSPYISFEFTMPDACIAPTNVNISDVQKYQMTLNWTPSIYADATDVYDIIISKTEIEDLSVAEITYPGVTGTSKVLDILDRNTMYYVYIRTNCGTSLGTTEWISTSATTTYDVDCETSETITLGTGTSTAYVVQTSYGNTYSQHIYTAAELAELGLEAGPINAIEFQYSGSSSTYRKEQSIYIGTTEKNVFGGYSAQYFETGLTLVYGPQQLAYPGSGWYRYEFATPFVWDGESNIVVGVLTNQPGTSQSSSTGWSVYGTSIGLTRSIRRYQDSYAIDINGLSDVGSGNSNSERPNIKFSVCNHVADPCPALEAAPVATDVTNTAATISWNVGKGDFASSYDVVLSDTAILDFNGIEPTAAGLTNTTYALTGLNANTNYYVYVRVNCVNENYDDGSSLWSPACEFLTELPCMKPAGFVYEHVYSDKVQLSWINKSTGTNWMVYVSDTVTVNVAIADCTVNGDTIHYLLTGLQPETQYRLKIQGDCGVDGISQLAVDSPLITTLSNITGFESFEIIGGVEIMDSVSVDVEHQQIHATVRKGTDLAHLQFNHAFADSRCTAAVDTAAFASPWDFSAPVTVRVFAEDTAVYQDWTLTFVEEPCATPYNVTVKNIERRTVDLVWALGDASTSFDLVISEEELEDPSAGLVQNITAVNDSGACTYAIAGLTRDTHYYVYLRTNCGESFGQWRNDEFTTKALTFCDGVTICDGTTTSPYFPFYGNYQDTEGMTSQFIYSSDMLTELRGKTISEMRFYSSSASKSYTGTNRVSIGITSAESFDEEELKPSPSQVVFTGNVSISDNEHVIEFDAPFTYPVDGGNLLIEYMLTQAGNYSSAYFYGVEKTDASYYEYGTTSSVESFLPKVTFSFCEENVPCPEVTDVVIADIDVNSATVTWTESTGDYANTSDIYYSTVEVEDFTGVEPQITGVTGNSAPLANLDQYTIYYVYVRTHCDGEGRDDGISGWTGTSFRTLAPCRVPGTPVPALTGKHTATVTWTNTSDTAQQADNFTYILSTTPIAAENLDSEVPTATGVAAVSVALSNLLSETTYHFYVRNECGTSYGSSPWDSCQFTMHPEMPAVINLQISDVASNAFYATWESDVEKFADETAWDVAVVAHGEEPAAWETVTVAEYFALNLEPETAYDFYVRANDGAAHYSLATMDSVNTTAIPDNCITLFDDTETNVYVPVYGLYADSYLKCQTVYPAAQLQNIAGSQLTGLTYYTSAPADAAWTGANFKVYLMEVDYTSISAFEDVETNATLVYEGSLDGTSSTMSVNFSTPYSYNGGNLLVAVYNTVIGTYKSCSFYGSEVENASVQGYSYTSLSAVTPSSKNFIPKTTFCATPVSCRPVTNLKVDNITYSSARARWYPGINGQTFKYYLGTPGMTAGELDSVTATVAPITANVVDLTSLARETEYSFYVQGLCQEGDSSVWMRVDFVTLPSCSAPATAVATLNNDTVSFDVTAGQYGTEGTYDYRYWKAGSADTVTVAGQTSHIDVVGLEGGVYSWEVRANCSGDDEGSSRWVAGNAFRMCGIYNLTYVEDFEQATTVGEAPSCWTVLEASGYSTVYPSVRNNGSSKALTLYLDSKIASPALSIPAGGFRASFSFATSSTTASDFNVLFTTDLENDSVFDTLEVYNASASGTLYVDCQIGDTVGYLVFDKWNGESSYYYYIDNLNIEALPVVDLQRNVLPDTTCGTIEVICNAADTTPAGLFVKDHTIALAAHAAVGRTFSHWENAAGDTISELDTVSLTLVSDSIVNAVFTYNVYDVATAVNDPAKGSATGDGSYQYGSQVTLTATPAEHFRLDTWTIDGQVVSTDPVFLFTVPDSSVTVVANFDVERDTIDLRLKMGEGTVLFIAEEDTTLILSDSLVVVDYNTPVKLIATAEEHYTFTSWNNGEELSDTVEFTVVGDTVLVPGFIGEEHVVTVSVVGDGTVTGDGTYRYGDVVTLVATPALGYEFSQWSNGETSDTLSFVIVSDTALTATFVVEEHVVTVSVVGEGTVTGDGTYHYGDVVTLVATPAQGYEFSQWSNGETSDTLSFVIVSDTALTATFIVKSAVEDVETVEYVAYVEGNDIVIYGAGEHNVAVYDMAGHLVQMVPHASDFERINVQVAGVYIIHVENLPATRVIVK